jgi:hypothetical protein
MVHARTVHTRRGGGTSAADALQYALCSRSLLPRMRRANAKSVFMSVTRLAWMVHRYLRTRPSAAQHAGAYSA